jgi:Domain of unknown function (DUF4440)
MSASAFYRKKKAAKRNGKIFTGRIESSQRGGEAFALVRDLDPYAKRRVQAILRRCGRGQDTDWKARMQIWNITPIPAAPAQTNAGLNPAERQEMEAIFEKFQAAYNARDIATLRSLHAKDDIEWRSWQGPATGDAIAERFAADFLGNPGKMVNKIVALYPIGNAICEIADSDVGGWKARTVTIYVRQGGVWKAKITYVNNAIHAEPTTSQEKQ